jgi:hypothetical protein
VQTVMMMFQSLPTLHIYLKEVVIIIIPYVSTLFSTISLCSSEFLLSTISLRSSEFLFSVIGVCRKLNWH